MYFKLKPHAIFSTNLALGVLTKNGHYRKAIICNINIAHDNYFSFLICSKKLTYRYITNTSHFFCIRIIKKCGEGKNKGMIIFEKSKEYSRFQLPSVSTFCCAYSRRNNRIDFRVILIEENALALELTAQGLLLKNDAKQKNYFGGLGSS